VQDGADAVQLVVLPLRRRKGGAQLPHLARGQFEQIQELGRDRGVTEGEHYAPTATSNAAGTRGRGARACHWPLAAHVGSQPRKHGKLGAMLRRRIERAHDAAKHGVGSGSNGGGAQWSWLSPCSDRGG
jgi:hypothetical protein